MKATSLESLLLLLHRNPDEAAALYRQLHTRLIRFFSINHTEDPIHLADVAMDRLARRAEEAGMAIDSPTSFALGIARHLVQEEARDRSRSEEVSRSWTSALAVSDPMQEERLDALEGCLSQLPVERRRLLESYYNWDDGNKTEHHRRTAEGLGLNLNALRNRVMRIRVEVETCLQRKLSDVSRQTDTPNKTTRKRQPTL